MKVAPVRWTISLAATEFGIDRRTLSTRVKAAGIVPGEDSCFSTKQITAALFGDMDGEKLRKMRAEADLAEMEVREKQKTSIPREVFFPILEQVCGAIAAVVKRSPLPQTQRDEILNELRDVPVALGWKGYKKADDPPGEQTAS